MQTIFLPLGLAAAVLFSPSFARAQPVAPVLNPLTLEQAQSLAASRSFAISAARRELEAADGGIQQAGAYRNPSLTTSVEDTRAATRTTTTTLDFQLEMGGKRGARVNAAERARDVAQATLDDVQAQVRSAVISAYFAALVAQERLALSLKSADLAGRSAEAVAKRVAAGKASPIEESRARIDQANAQLEWAESQADLQTARHALAALWEESEPGFTEVAGDIAELPERDAAAELAQRLETSPALLMGRLETQRRRALVEVERSKSIPDITLSLGAKRDGEMGRTQAIIGLSIPLPIFDRNQGAVVEANKRAQKADDEYRAARIHALNELQTAARKLAVARASSQMLQISVLPAAQQAYDAATRAFEAGKFGFLDVIDSQRSLIQARARYLNTLSAAYQAASTIDRWVGR